MAEKLREVIKDYKNAYLLEQYYLRRAEWSDEAVKIMEDEVSRRNIPEQESAPYREGRAPAEPTIETKVYKREEFVPFDHLFSQIDLLLVTSIFGESEIPFYVDNPPSEMVLPVESQTTQRLRIHVHRDFAAKAQERIDEHFHKEDGAYRLKFADIREKLRAFSFSEIRLADTELYDEVDVTFTTEESSVITAYARRLQAQIDTVEQDRTVFYYDNLDDLIDIIGAGSRKTLRKMDLLTVIEVLQIYSDDPQFPAVMNEAVGALLDFFLVNP